MSLLLTRMTTQTVCIPVEEYDILKKKAKIADDAIIQLELSLEDLKHGRVRRF